MTVLANPIPMVSGWVYARLLGDADLITAGINEDRVWEYAPPEGHAGWYISYQRVGGGDVRGLGTVRFLTKLPYLIKVVDRGADWDHEHIANRIDALFSEVYIPIAVADPPGWIESSHRVEPFDQPETVGGVQYRHLGGVYEIAATTGE